MNSADVMLPFNYRTEGLSRIDIIDWDEIHDAIQKILASLDERILQQCAPMTVTVKSGKNSGRSWDLFSYRVYHADRDPEIDAAVVGIFCVLSNEHCVIHGDIAGEGSGDILFEAPDKERIGRLAILEAVRDTAELLAQQPEIIAAAVSDDRRRID